MSERQLIVNDGRIYWLFPDGSHRGVTAADATTINALRARVARLEAALRDCKRYAEDHDDEWVPFRVDDALKDAP